MRFPVVTRGRAVAAAVLACVLAPACSDSDSGGGGAGGAGGGGGSSGPTAPYSATEAARAIVNDTTGDALAAATQEHVLTSQEEKLVAGFWLVVVLSERTGTVSPQVLESNVLDELAALARQYPSLFVFAETGSQGGGMSPQFSCESPCVADGSPLEDFAKDLARDLAKEALGELLPDGGLKDLLELGDKLNGALEATESFTQAADQALTTNDVSAMFEGVGAALGAVGAVAGAAAILAPVALPLSAAAAVLGAGSAILGMMSKYEQLQAAMERQQACKAFQAESCPPPPDCAEAQCPAGQHCGDCGGIVGCIPDGASCCGPYQPGIFCAAGGWCAPCFGAGTCVPNDVSSIVCCSSGSACPMDEPVCIDECGGGCSRRGAELVCCSDGLRYGTACP